MKSPSEKLPQHQNHVSTPVEPVHQDGKDSLPHDNKGGLQQIVAQSNRLQQLKAMSSLANGAIQRKAATTPPATPPASKNETGMPDGLKTGIEQLSGYAMNDVRVHYNSTQPAQLQAHAFAQGNQIHIAHGQEQHLPHEAWHVVQQKQGRVQATRQLKGKVHINNDAGLEAEADRMGMVALAVGTAQRSALASARGKQLIQHGLSVGQAPLQRVKITSLKTQTVLKKYLAGLVEEFSGGSSPRYTAKFVKACMTELDRMDFGTEEEYRNALVFDLENKSENAGQMTLQEMYMTHYGWSGRAKKDITLDPKGGDQLKIFRTMDLAEWLALKGGTHSSLGGHLGDFKEALNYLYGKSDKPKVMVELPLTAGNERALFAPKNLAMPALDTNVKNKNMWGALKRDKIGTSYTETTNSGEGNAVDKSKVGIKLEDHGEAGYSFAISKGGTSAETFMKLVDIATMGVIGYSDGTHAQMFAKDTDFEGMASDSSTVTPTASIVSSSTASTATITSGDSSSSADSSTTTKKPASKEPASGTKSGKKDAQVAAPLPVIPLASANRVVQGPLHAFLNAIAVGWNQDHQPVAPNALAGVHGNQGYMAHQVADGAAIAMGEDMEVEAEDARAATNHLAVGRNGGSRALCFIYALLMGLTGQSEGEVRNMVNAIAPRAGADEGWIAADSVIAGNVLAQVNQIYGIQVDLIVVQNGVEGTIVSGRAGTAGGTTVIIRQNAGHYDTYR